MGVAQETEMVGGGNLKRPDIKISICRSKGDLSDADKQIIRDLVRQLRKEEVERVQAVRELKAKAASQGAGSSPSIP